MLNPRNLWKNFLAERKAKKLDEELKGKRCIINNLKVDGKDVVALIEGVAYTGKNIIVYTLWRYGITRYSNTYSLNEISMTSRPFTQ